MASIEEIEDDILATITHALGQLRDAGSNSRAAANHALAVNHLTEARAWLSSVNQPHGGTANPSEGK